MEHRELIEDIVYEPFAWPGAYEKYAITDDGGTLCRKCVYDNRQLCAEAYRGDGWYIVALGLVEHVDDIFYCDHCGRMMNEQEGYDND